MHWVAEIAQKAQSTAILQTFLPFLLASHRAFLTSQSESIFHCFSVIRTWKGWYTVAGVFRTEVRLDLCCRMSASFSQCFYSQDLYVYILSDKWQLHKPRRTVKHAIAQSKMCWMSGQVFRHCWQRLWAFFSLFNQMLFLGKVESVS